MRRVPRARRSSQRGMSLIEALIAMTLMALVIAGILQMFSLSLLMSFGAGARTELTGKCEQVVENIRLAQVLSRAGDTTLATAVGWNTSSLPRTVTLPYTAAELGTSPYWGPTQANVVEGPDLPYKLSYVISADAAAPTDFLLVTVTATAVNNPTVATTQSTGTVGKRNYMGMSKLKRVDYVAYIHQ